jgi:hypothetical protein
MILRWLVLGLLVANVLVFASGQGWLGPIGVGTGSPREPGRLQQQIRPDLLRVLPADTGAAPDSGPTTAATPAGTVVPAIVAGASAPSGGLSCLETEALPPTALDGAEQALAAVLPGRGWVRASREVAPQYAVVIGPMSSRDALQKKREELGRLRVGVEEIRLPGSSGPALALGRYDSQASAEAGLDSFGQRGVRTARVVALREPVVEMRLRVERLSPEQAEALRALKAPALGAQGLLPCSVR